MLVASTSGRRLGNGWKQYREQVTRKYGSGSYTILLQEEPVTDAPRMGHYRRALGAYGAAAKLGVITPQEGGVLSTAAGVGTTVGVSALASGTAIGSFAGPIGAGVGALVGVIAGLFEASAARAKGATEENQAINEYLPSWDSGLQQIFAAANAGTITGAEAASLVPSLMSAWWQAAAQFKGLPGVADASGGGGNCGSYISGQTTPCTPSGGPGCDKSCTAFCCVGCHDLMPSAQDAIRILGLSQGGSVNVCTVYGSGYGATQRNGYSLSYAAPKIAAPVATATGTTSTAATAAIASSTVASEAAAAVSALTGGSISSLTTGTILGIPWYLVVGLGLFAAVELF
jgi:hypothetical protein